MSKRQLAGSNDYVEMVSIESMAADAREGALQHLTVTLGDAGDVTEVDVPDWVRGVRITPSATIWWALNEAPVIGGGGGDQVVEVAAGADDGTWSPAITGSTFSAGGTALQMRNDGGDHYHSFVRFVVNKAQGEVIDSATLTVISTGTDTANMLVSGVDADNAAAPTDVSSADDLLTMLTTANTARAAGAAGSGVAVDIDVTTTVQELLDRAGWQSGSHMVFVLQYTSGTMTEFAALEHATFAPPTLTIAQEVPVEWLAGNVIDADTSDTRLVAAADNRELHIISETASATVLIEAF